MSRGCWTCRDRKIRCDQGTPTCANCDLSGRKCLGYGLRLSWPQTRRKDRVRMHATVSKTDRGHSLLIDAPVDLDMVNVSFNDMCLFNKVSARGSASRFVRRTLEIPKSIPLELIEQNDATIINYYITNGHQLFPSVRGKSLAPLLLKISLNDRSVASRGVNQALIALSCLHLHRNHMALTYKSKAISSLAKSLTLSTDTKVAFQNIVTSMLLCMFEVHHTSGSSKNWALYLCGVKKIIYNSLMHRKIRDYDYVFLTKWVGFHEILSGFSIIHWIPVPEYATICFEYPFSQRLGTSQDSEGHVQGKMWHFHQVLDAVTSMCAFLDPRKGNTLDQREHQKVMNAIEHKLRYETPSYSKEARTEMDKWDIVIELYRLAALIYLNKAVLGYSGEEVQHDRLVDEAFSLSSRIGPDDAPWPLFIIACEARNDLERTQILRMFRCPSLNCYSSNVNWVREIIESFWNLRDLDEDQRQGYFTQMSAVISSNAIPPPFF